MESSACHSQWPLSPGCNQWESSAGRSQWKGCSVHSKWAGSGWTGGADRTQWEGSSVRRKWAGRPSLSQLAGAGGRCRLQPMQRRLSPQKKGRRLRQQPMGWRRGLDVASRPRNFVVGMSGPGASATACDPGPRGRRQSWAELLGRWALGPRPGRLSEVGLRGSARGQPHRKKLPLGAVLAPLPTAPAQRRLAWCPGAPPAPAFLRSRRVPRLSRRARVGRQLSFRRICSVFSHD